ncbi:MAG: MFS transporter [Candidatus Paceibacterota bacterium]
MNKISKIKRMYILSFVFSLHIAISAYVNSKFLTGIINEDYVGVLYTIAFLLTFFLLIKSSGVLKNFGNRRLILIFLITNMISLVGLITSTNPYIIGISFVLFSLTNTLVFFCIDIFIEHFGTSRTIGKTRGLYLTILNIAWVLSPLFSTFLITKEGGYKTIYIIAFLMVAIMTIGLVFSTKSFKDKTYKKTPFLETFKYLKTNSHMLAIVTINFLLQFFYVWMIIYTPIYFYNHLGFNWNQIGIMFTIMLIPFIILELPIGIFIDKYNLNKKILLYIGFSIMISFTFLISFITTSSITLWAIILFMTRVGASMIESTAEIYFFTHVKEEDAYLLGIYRDMTPVSYIIAPVIATLVFLIFPYKYLFVILSIILATGFIYIQKLKYNHENILPSSKIIKSTWRRREAIP